MDTVVSLFPKIKEHRGGPFSSSDTDVDVSEFVSQGPKRKTQFIPGGSEKKKGD